MVILAKIHPKAIKVQFQVHSHHSQIAKVDLVKDLYKSHQILHLALIMEVQSLQGSVLTVTEFLQARWKLSKSGGAIY